MATVEKGSKVVFVECRGFSFDGSRSSVLVYQYDEKSLSYTFTAYDALKEDNTKYTITGRLGGSNEIESGAVAISFDRIKRGFGFISVFSISPGFDVREEQGKEIIQIQRNGETARLFDVVRCLTVSHLQNIYNGSGSIEREVGIVYGELINLGLRINEDTVMPVDPKATEKFFEEFGRYLR